MAGPHAVPIRDDGAVTVYDTIGGQAAVDAVVDELYRRILDDPDLATYFDGIDVDQIKRHQRAFIAAALGGPDAYPGRTMQAAHAGRRITDAAFDKVVVHLVATLRQLDVPGDVVGQIGDALAPLRGQIVEVPARV
jgi:hemoglobin